MLALSLMCILSPSLQAQEKPLWISPNYNIEYVKQSELYDGLVEKTHNPPHYFDFYNSVYHSLGLKSYTSSFKPHGLKGKSPSYTEYKLNNGYLHHSKTFSIILDTTVPGSGVYTKKTFPVEESIYEYDADKLFITVKQQMLQNAYTTKSIILKYYYNKKFTIDSMIRIEERAKEVVKYQVDSTNMTIFIEVLREEDGERVFGYVDTIRWSFISKEEAEVYKDLLPEINDADKILKLSCKTAYKQIDKFIIENDAHDSLRVIVRVLHNHDDDITRRTWLTYRQYTFSGSQPGLRHCYVISTTYKGRPKRYDLPISFNLDRTDKFFLITGYSPTYESEKKYVYKVERLTPGKRNITLPVLNYSGIAKKYKFTYK